MRSLFELIGLKFIFRSVQNFFIYSDDNCNWHLKANNNINKNSRLFKTKKNMGQDWTSCSWSTTDADMDKNCTLEPTFPQIEVSETDMDTSYCHSSQLSGSTLSFNKKRKAITFRDKYQKG